METKFTTGERGGRERGEREEREGGKGGGGGCERERSSVSMGPGRCLTHPLNVSLTGRSASMAYTIPARKHRR